MIEPDLPDPADLRRGCLRGPHQLDRSIGRRGAAEKAVGDQQTLLRDRGDPAVDPGVGRSDRPLEPGTQLDQRPIEPDLDAGLVGRLDPVQHVGPPRLELGRIGIGPIDEGPRHVHGGHLP